MDRSERNLVLAELKADLTPRGAVYQGRPHLRLAAGWSLLCNMPMGRLLDYCRRLGTDVAELTERLEASGMITAPRRPKARKGDGGGVLF
jgi:hypothetical protein